jgi:hypothetical protein
MKSTLTQISSLQCADITFQSDAAPLASSDCVNSTGVGGSALSATGDSKKGAAGRIGANPAAVMSVFL